MWQKSKFGKKKKVGNQRHSQSRGRWLHGRAVKTMNEAAKDI
jgi:hypothetical protein